MRTISSLQMDFYLVYVLFSQHNEKLQTESGSQRQRIRKHIQVVLFGIFFLLSNISISIFAEKINNRNARYSGGWVWICYKSISINQKFKIKSVE